MEYREKTRYISAAEPAALIRIRLDPIYTQLTEKDGIFWKEEIVPLLELPSIYFGFEGVLWERQVLHWSRLSFGIGSTLIRSITTHLISRNRNGVSFRIEEMSRFLFRVDRRDGKYFERYYECTRKKERPIPAAVEFLIRKRAEPTHFNQRM